MQTKKKSSKNSKKHSSEKTKRNLELKEELEEYARIEKMLGNGRATVLYPDNRNVLAHIRGSLKRCRMNVGDIVLVSIRSFQEDKCDIIHKYEKDEILKLVKLEEISSTFIESSHVEEKDREDIIFEEDQEVDFEEI